MDIVERLRDSYDQLLMCGKDYSDVVLDAADEIERLRKVLEHVSCMCLGQCVHGVKDREKCIRYTARSALQQKDSE